MIENWKHIEEDPRYQVSDHGRVIGPSGRVLKTTLAGLGYPQFCLGSKKYRTVHRCVAQAFIGPIPPKHEVNHKNGVKDDNRLENLEIITRSENKRHSWQVLGNYKNRELNQRGANHNRARLSDDDVRMIRDLSQKGVPRPDLAKQFRISPDHLKNILNRHRWRHLV